MINILSGRDFLTVLFMVGFGGCLTFVGLYAWRSPGWVRSEVGRNLMTMMAVLLIILGLVVVQRFTGPLPRWTWTLSLVALDVVIWRRVIILWRKQHESINS